MFPNISDDLTCLLRRSGCLKDNKARYTWRMRWCWHALSDSVPGSAKFRCLARYLELGQAEASRVCSKLNQYNLPRVYTNCMDLYEIVWSVCQVYSYPQTKQFWNCTSSSALPPFAGCIFLFWRQWSIDAIVPIHFGCAFCFVSYLVCEWLL